MSVLEALNNGVIFTNHYLWNIVRLHHRTGIVFTVKLKGLQIVRIRETLSLSLSGIGERKKSSKVSSFEVFCIGMSERISVGNITGGQPP